MTHKKRLSAPKAWPIERKTETFTVHAGAGPHGEAGVPLVIVLRDVLGYVDTAKEAKYAARSGYIAVNGSTVTDTRLPLGLFDIITFDEREEYYRIFPEAGGRLSLVPIDPAAAETKLSKVTDKRQVAGGRTQLSLHDGRTVLVDDPDTYRSHDSVIIDLETGEVVHHLPYGEGSMVTAVAGSHAGEIGTIESIDVHPGSSDNTLVVATDDGRFETVEDYVVVIDENFTDGDADE